MSKKTLPKIGWHKAETSVPRGSDGSDVFPRQEHPDDRSAAKWLRDMEQRPKKWYPKKRAK